MQRMSGSESSRLVDNDKKEQCYRETVSVVNRNPTLSTRSEHCATAVIPVIEEVAEVPRWEGNSTTTVQVDLDRRINRMVAEVKADLMQPLREKRKS